MNFELRQFIRVLFLCALIIMLGIPSRLVADAHIVSSADLQKEVVATTQLRQHNLETVRQFLSSPTAVKAMKSAQMDPRKVKMAVSTLSNEELAQLASRVRNAQADFAAGNFSDRDLIIVILAIAALILIIVAVR